MSLIDILAQWVVQTIHIFGYFGIAFLMALESIILPLPSEIILPFAGYLVAQGTFSFWAVVLFATIGSVFGSWVSYEIGRAGGRPFMQKYGKFFLLDEKKLKWTDRWFRKHGEGTVFVSRLLPLTRYFISIPAGIARMGRKKFLLYTAIGAGIWNMALTYAGVVLGTHWLVIIEYAAQIEIVIVSIIILVIIWYVVKAIDRYTQVMHRIAENKQVQRNIQTVRKGIRTVHRFSKKNLQTIIEKTDFPKKTTEKRPQKKKS